MVLSSVCDGVACVLVALHFSLSMLANPKAAASLIDPLPRLTLFFLAFQSVTLYLFSLDRRSSSPSFNVMSCSQIRLVKKWCTTLVRFLMVDVHGGEGMGLQKLAPGKLCLHIRLVKFA